MLIFSDIELMIILRAIEVLCQPHHPEFETMIVAREKIYSELTARKRGREAEEAMKEVLNKFKKDG